MVLISRNDPCWCGSGKKYKKCHMEKEEILLDYKNKGYRIPKQELIKTQEDIEGLRKSAAITKAILDMMEEKVKEGVTTNEINQWAHEYTMIHGGTPAPLGYNGYPKSVCTSINEVICHGIPEDRRLVEGDIVNIDVTTILDGYFADASRMYTIGNISEEARKIVQCAKECLQVGIDAVKPYMPFNVIGAAIEAHATKYGYSVVKDFGGHGIGLKFHEDPFIYHYDQGGKGMIMLPGMVFTIEPMINQGSYQCNILEDNWTAVTVDGGLSAQWEHTLLVTETGVEILTK
ncbi:methionyl aminopeptidase [Alkaliphilus hydrothermalis]|uniref:Methionine aminopeptidase n=1 Tax=Alkaliphilus hydrothermalis TaxID=1482730 RepID=A0ABS2NRH4_9FIRM|nr:methionyl aminopeptidase [Alkaliphilus hydrothermalis]MBM7615477.1 methionyl aminopeptidase [Alkaliphilus hydrothermalis]